MSRLKSIVPILVVILSFAFAIAAIPIKVDAAMAPKFTKKTYKVGKGYKVTLKVKNTGGQKVTWKIGKKAKKRIKVVHTTNNSITVKGKKVGKATVTARVGAQKAKAIVRIKKKHVTLSAKSLTTKKGSSKNLSVGGAKSATFRSTNKKVVQVRKIGRTKARIIGKKKGTAYIKIKANGKVLRCRVKVKGSGKKKVPRYEKKKYSTGTITRVNFKKGDISVKIKPVLEHKELAKEYRKYFNVPDNVKLYDRIDVTFTNNLNLNNVEVPFEIISFGTKYCLTRYQGGSTAKNMYKKGRTSWNFSWEDSRKEGYFDRIKLKKKQTKTIKAYTCYPGVKFVSFEENEPIQVNVESFQSADPNKGLAFLYFPETGKTAKSYMKKYAYKGYNGYTEYYYYRVSGSNPQYPN